MGRGGRQTIDALVDAMGHVPLPPYIHRADTAEDRERYQTVFAAARGSIAAPTAGLHFDEALVAAIDAAGIERATITLHVGYGTFKPVRVDEVEAHVVDPEPYEISDAAAAAINAALDAGRRVVAVGTTTTRALEDAARRGGGPRASGTRRGGALHLSRVRVPGDFGADDEFPSPEVVAADAGRGVRRPRARAGGVSSRRSRSGYRFYSYGDAMLIL